MPRQSKPHLHKGRWRTRIQGKEHDLGTDRRAAFAKFYALMSKAARPADTDAPESVAELIEKFLATDPGSHYLAWLRPYLLYAGRVALAEIERPHLITYADWLKSYRYTRLGKKDPETGKRKKLPPRPLSPTSARHYVTAAGTVLRFGQKRGWLAELPERPEMLPATRKPRDIDADRLAGILDALPEHAGRILRFIAATGCRPSEACGLQWAHVHLDAGVCIMTEHKTAKSTGKPRTLYLTPEAAEILKGMRPNPGPVFTNRSGEPYTSTGLRSILRRRGATPYQLRHTFAQLASDTIPEEVLGKLLGHNSPATTRVYYEIRDGRAKSAAKLVKLPFGAKKSETA